MDLTKIFSQYVGVQIRDPDRMSCDVDPVAENIYKTAQENGLTLTFSKDANFIDRNCGGKGVTAYIEKTRERTPQWTVKRFALT